MPVETEPPPCTLLRQPNLHGIQPPTITMITRPVCLSVHKRSDVPSRPELHHCFARCRTKRVAFPTRQWLPETKHSNTDRDEEIRVDDRGTATTSFFIPKPREETKSDARNSHVGRNHRPPAPVRASVAHETILRVRVCAMLKFAKSTFHKKKNSHH